MDLNNMFQARTPIYGLDSSAKKNERFTFVPRRMCELLKDKDICDVFGTQPNKLFNTPFRSKGNHNIVIKDATSVFMPQGISNLPSDVIQECSKSSVKKPEKLFMLEPKRMIDLNLDIENESKCGARRKLINSDKKVVGKCPLTNKNKSTIPVSKKRFSFTKPKFNEISTRKTIQTTKKNFSQTSKTRISGIMELQSTRKFNPPTIELPNTKTNARIKKFSSITEESSIEKKNVNDLVVQNSEKLSVLTNKITTMESILLDLSSKINKFFEKVQANENFNGIDKPVVAVTEQSKLELQKCDTEINLDNFVVTDNTTDCVISAIASISNEATAEITQTPKKSTNMETTPTTLQPVEKSTDALKDIQSLDEFIIIKEVMPNGTQPFEKSTNLNQIKQIPKTLSEPAIENTNSTNQHEQSNNIIMEASATSERPATNLEDRLNACVIENPVNDPEITIMSESTELSSFSECSDIKLQDLSLLISNLNDGSFDGDCEQSSSKPLTPKAKVKFNIEPNKHLSTPDLIESSIKCYNDLRKDLSFLCTPKLPVGKHVVTTPGTQPSHRKILSRKIQQQLFTLHRNSDS